MARAFETGAALVTGASGGIGEELARVFAAHGHPLVLVARSADRLEAVASAIRERHGVAVEIIPLDLGRHDAPAQLVEALGQRNASVRHLVNNAGFGLAGAFAEHPLEGELGLLDLNIRSLVELTHRLLPGLRKGGGILNVASIAAYQPGPFMATYYASKAFVLSFSEALALELRDEGVRVTALCPGPTATGFQSRAGMKSSPLFRLMPVSSASQVAESGYRAYRNGRTVCIPGLASTAAARFAGLTPHWASGRIARLLNRGRS